MFFFIEGSSRKWIQKERKSKQCEKMPATHTFESSNVANSTNTSKEFAFTDLKLLIPDEEEDVGIKDCDEDEECSSLDDDFESLGKNGSNEDAQDSSFDNVSLRNSLINR